MFKDRHLKKDSMEYLVPRNPRTARFYHQPKIHEHTVPVPGRPIVSSCGTPTEHISEYVDYHLQPLVIQTRSYLKDTTDFLQKLTAISELPACCILVTLDISSLYTNIPYDEGISACSRALETRPFPDPPTSYLLKMMEQILMLNCFEFNNEQYLQSQGTAMGTRMAPSHANLFMADLEEKMLTSTHTRPYLWWRFIDDVFYIWEHSQQSLNNFLQCINQFHPTIKFTAEYSSNRVTFWIPWLLLMEIQFTLT